MTNQDKGNAMSEVFGSAIAEAYKHKDKDNKKAKELVNKMYESIPNSTDYERLPIKKSKEKSNRKMMLL